MKVAVLGGGNTGCCLSAYLVLKGLEVVLYENKEYWHEHIDAIIANDSIISLSGPDFRGDAKINAITNDLGRAVRGTDIIFISMVLWRHHELLANLAPLLTDGQTVLFSAGNFGSIRLRRLLGPDSAAVVGEMSGNVFPCRMVSDTEAIIAIPVASKLVAAFPARDTEKLIKNTREALSCYPARNVFEAALNAPNVVVHLAGSLLNLASVEKNPDFRLYQEGLTQGVLAVIKAVEAEKALIMDRMGYKNVTHSPFMERLMAYGEHPELNTFRGLEGPSSRLHRYIHEDAAGGNSLMLSLAATLGIRLPLFEALVSLASAANHEDYANEGITMKKLGFGDASRTADQINEILRDGFQANNQLAQPVINIL